MTVPLPAAGSTNWYDWAQQTHSLSTGAMPRLVARVVNSSTPASGLTIGNGELLLADGSGASLVLTIAPGATGGAKRTDGNAANGVSVAAPSGKTIGSLAASSVPLRTRDQAQIYVPNSADSTNIIILAGHYSLTELDARFTARAATASVERTGFGRLDDFRSDTDGVTLAARNGGKTVTGHPWTLGFVGAGTSADLKVVGNVLRFDNTSASYMWTTGSSAAPPDEATVEFYFESGSTTGAGVAIAFSKNTAAAVGSAGVFTDAVHIACTPAGCNIGIYDGPSAVLSNFSVNALALPTDGTRFTLTAKRIAHDRVRLTIPAYLDVIARDARIPLKWGPSVGTEHYQPASSFSTDARPILTGYRVGHAAARAMPLDPVSPLLGLPGGTLTFTSTAAFGTGTTRYYPLEVRDPIVVTACRAEITTAGAAGAKLRPALLLADASWQPKTLINDFGEFAADAVGVAGPIGLSIALAPGRYLLGDKASESTAVRRYYGYQVPSSASVVPTMGGNSFAQYLGVAEAYGAWPATPTAWTSAVGASSGAAGFLCPLLLSWVGA